MYEVIITTVGSIIESFFSGYFQRNLTAPEPVGSYIDTEAINIRLDELEKIFESRLKQESELRQRDSSSNAILYLNQALQLFFEFLKSSDIQISITHPDNDSTEFNFQSCPSKQGRHPDLDAIADDILDFETIKPINDMIGLPGDTAEAGTDGSSSDSQPREPGPISAAQIMKKSRERLCRRLNETKLEKV